MIGARFDEVTLWADDDSRKDDDRKHGDPDRDRTGAVALLVAPHSMGSGYVVLAESSRGPGAPGGGFEEWVVGQVPVGAFARPRILSFASAYDDLGAAVDDFKARTIIGSHPAALFRLIEETRRTVL